MTNLFGSLDVEIWDLLGIWCVEFEISDYLSSQDIFYKDYLSTGHGTVKFQRSCLGGFTTQNV